MGNRKRSENLFDESSVLLFWAKVDRTEDPDQCWLWTGARISSGYGALTRGTDHRFLAHRFSYQLHNGEYNQDLFVCHSCDTPLCVNPLHLFLGDNSDNMKDCSKKGRLQIPRLSGESHPRAKINRKIAQQIRRLRSKGLSEMEVAKKLGITKRIVNGVSSGATWREE